MTRHDPDGAAARYLGGVMSRRSLRRFEDHLLECGDCWREVHLGGAGRGYAEAARELAPHALRERIRAEIWLAASPRRLGLLLPVVVAVVVAAAGSTFAVVTSGQPAAIEALVEDFQGHRTLAQRAAAQLPASLGDLALVGVEAGRVEGLSVVGHRYRDAAGHRVTVYRADGVFPMADGARAGEGRTWRAEAGGAVLLCSDRPFPALVVGDDDREVVLAARRLGLVPPASSSP